MQLLARGCHYQFPVLDTFNTDQFIGNFLHNFCRSPHHQNFETVMGIKVYMERGDYIVMMCMLVRPVWMTVARTSTTLPTWIGWTK